MDRRAFFLGLAAAGAASAAEPPHAAWDRLLKAYVVAGADGLNRVRYGAWAANASDRAALTAYIASLESARPAAMTRAEQWAFWANLYNAVTVKVILDRYPASSIRDIRLAGATPLVGGPWKAKLVTLADKPMSLDDIEHGVLRPTMKDPRVHYSVNCASVGCPNLLRAAFRAETLEQDLDANARAYIDSPRGVRVVSGGVRLSSIYSWFKDDFGTEAQLRTHLAQYAQPALAQTLRTARIVGYGYDWKLNDAKGQA